MSGRISPWVPYLYIAGMSVWLDPSALYYSGMLSVMAGLTRRLLLLFRIVVCHGGLDPPLPCSLQPGTWKSRLTR